MDRAVRISSVSTVAVEDLAGSQKRFRRDVYGAFGESGITVGHEDGDFFDTIEEALDAVLWVWDTRRFDGSPISPWEMPEIRRDRGISLIVDQGDEELSERPVRMIEFFENVDSRFPTAKVTNLLTCDVEYIHVKARRKLAEDEADRQRIRSAKEIVLATPLRELDAFISLIEEAKAERRELLAAAASLAVAE